MKLEVVVVPVSDVDRAKDFYKALLRRAAAPPGGPAEKIGYPGPDWPDWHAQYMMQEQAGRPGQARQGAGR
jgi:catechol 2,3-dioxygenase-like lactoylglutathione lyase family enzyme